MSCGQIALRDMGVPINRYYASEIDKHAIKQTQLNFPDTIQLGDVERWREWDIDWGGVDLLLAGSPCQGFSLAGKMLGHEDPRSRLFWVFVDILKHVMRCNPKALWLLENVRMKAEHEALINDALGLQPVVINSALVSAQNRVRLYWTNIRTEHIGLFGELHTAIPQPLDRGISVRDIIDEHVDDRYYLSDVALKFLQAHALKRGKANVSIVNEMDKSLCLTVSNTAKYHLDTNFVRGKARSIRVGGDLSTDEKHSWDVIKLDKQLRPKTQQDKASCLTAGGHSGGNHSDMDILAIRRKPTSEQTIEMRSDNKTNTLASVTKDNLVAGVIQGFTDPPAFRPMAGNKAPTMLARARQDGAGQPCIKDDISLRRLTPKECARLQTIPEWYKWECSDTQAYKMLGNGWTVEVIKYILSFLDN